MHCATLAPRDGIGQGIPPITATLRVPQEPLKSPGKSISASPPSRWSANFMVVCVVGSQRLHPRPCEVPASLSEGSKGSRKRLSVLCARRKQRVKRQSQLTLDYTDKHVAHPGGPGTMCTALICSGICTCLVYRLFSRLSIPSSARSFIDHWQPKKLFPCLNGPRYMQCNWI